MTFVSKFFSLGIPFADTFSVSTLCGLERIGSVRPSRKSGLGECSVGMAFLVTFLSDFKPAGRHRGFRLPADGFSGWMAFCVLIFNIQALIKGCKIKIGIGAKACLIDRRPFLEFERFLVGD